MTSLLERFDKAFENRVRLAVMSVLVVSEKTDFNALKEALNVTDGNLASHIAMLESCGYVAVRKRFIGKKPQTSYTATASGRRAFADHIAALEQLLKSNLSARQA